MARTWEAKLGRHVSDDYYLDEYRQFTAIDAQHSMPLVADGSNNIYPKGALVLRMLRRRLGDERFWASIHLFLTRHQFGSAVTEDFRQAVLDATGENLAQFWAEWMYRPGYPRFSVHAAYDSASHASLTLRVQQTQSDSAGADSAWPPMASVFHAPVTILIGTAKGDVERRAQLDAREQTIVIDSLPGAPTMVVFDAGNTIVKGLEFPQPTSWLATQLARDPDLWNRWWAIGELARHPDDAVAGKAIARAATSADYFLTREHAVTALPSFPAAIALPALELARHDTSAQVRAFAVAALGRSAARTLSRPCAEAWSDTSYGVEAAAIRPLILADSANRAAWVARGFAASSYRDVVRNAALDAVARAGDWSVHGGGRLAARRNAERGEHAPCWRRDSAAPRTRGAHPRTRRFATLRARMGRCARCGACRLTCAIRRSPLRLARCATRRRRRRSTRCSTRSRRSTRTNLARDSHASPAARARTG